MRLVGKLTAKRVAKLLSKGEVGNYHDGQGLRLEIRSANSGSWVTRFELNGRAHWMGLGSCRTFSLSEARERNRRIRQRLADGVNPLLERRAAQAAERAAEAKAIMFAGAAESFIASNSSKWRNPRSASQWTTSLQTYAYPIIGALPVGAIDVPLVLKVLEQHIAAEPAGSFWATRTETASRVRGRIEAILDWATARGLRTGDNPASWKTIGKVLPARSAKTVPHPALPYAEVPAFMGALGERQDVAARALAFTILTAARTNETVGARWSEIDLTKKTWTVPASRMKAGVEHFVPLCDLVCDLLAGLPREAGNDFVFVGRITGRGLGRDALLDTLADMGRRDLTVHGFRSSFRDWAAEQTAFSHDVCEAALAHTVGDASERAYRRTKQLPRRRQLMDAWATYCLTTPVAAGVTTLPVGVGLSR